MNWTPHCNWGQRYINMYGIMWQCNERNACKAYAERTIPGGHRVYKRWREITHDPLTLRLGDARLYVIWARKSCIEATKQEALTHTAVETGKFTGASFFAGVVYSARAVPELSYGPSPPGF